MVRDNAQSSILPEESTDEQALRAGRRSVLDAFADGSRPLIQLLNDCHHVQLSRQETRRRCCCLALSSVESSRPPPGSDQEWTPTLASWSGTDQKRCRQLYHGERDAGDARFTSWKVGSQTAVRVTSPLPRFGGRQSPLSLSECNGDGDRASADDTYRLRSGNL